MHVKFRLCYDNEGNRVTRVFFVGSDNSLELVTQIPGWSGIDFETMPQDSVDKVASAIADKVDDTKFIG